MWENLNGWGDCSDEAYTVSVGARLRFFIRFVNGEIARRPWMRSHLSIFQEGFGSQKI